MRRTKKWGRGRLLLQSVLFVALMAPAAMAEEKRCDECCLPRVVRVCPNDKGRAVAVRFRTATKAAEFLLANQLRLDNRNETAGLTIDCLATNTFLLQGDIDDLPELAGADVVRFNLPSPQE